MARGRALRRFLIVLIIIAALGGASIYGKRYVPERMNPWAPLDLNEPPNFLTRVKLNRLRDDNAMCLSVLAQTEIRFQPLPDKVTGAGCGLKNAVNIQETSAEIGSPFSMTCMSAISLVLWERHVLQPAADGIFGQPVIRIEHMGSYSCRNMNHKVKGKRSLHATAEAIDIGGFVLSDGQRIRVSRDWKPDTAESLFLHHIRDGACELFSAVLSPDYNKLHHDHFHFDSGSYRTCR